MSRDPSHSEGFGGPARALRQISGPLGCLALVFVLPFVLLGMLVFSLFARHKVSQATERMRRVPRTPEDVERETALCSLVRYLALDEEFTREEALATPVIISSASVPPVAELLDEAEGRGWVRAAGDRLAVTPAGREEAERFLIDRGV